MQIQNVTLAQNNYSQRHNPNFTSIKSVKCEGLYKKTPELATDVVEAFKANPKAMEFCRKYDVDIVFYAFKDMHQSVESSLHIFYDNISKSKFRKFLDKFLGYKDDKISIHAWSDKYSLPESLKESTVKLIEAMSPQKKVKDGYRGGLLDSHIELTDKKIQDTLAEKAAKLKEKQERLKAANEAKLEIPDDKSAKIQFENAKSKLQKSMDELINKGS